MPKDIPNTQIRKRVILLMLIILIPSALVIISNIYNIQFVDNERYETNALNQQLRSTPISAERGSIYDTNMKTLAMSATVWDVVLAPADIQSTEELDLIADFLVETLGVEREEVLTRGAKTSSLYEVVARKVESDLAEQVTQFAQDNGLKGGLYLEENSKRYYPYGNLASTILGFTNADNTGAYGIEAMYEDVLGGSPGMTISAKNAKGGDMLTTYQQVYEPVPGNSLVLTIDEEIQHFLESHMEIAVNEHNVRNRAAGIVMDIETGAILAMASKPDFDPNEPLEIYDPKTAAALEEFKLTASAEEYNEMLGEAQFSQWGNKAIAESYEPGSVFKVLTAAAALDSGKVTATDQYFYCPGYHIVAGRVKGCWKASGHGEIDFTEALKYSCNPAFMMVGELLGGDLYDFYYERFGLKEVTNIDLPGEADGLYYPIELLNKESGEELASSSFGQTFKVTPIQLITAISGTLNDGKLMQPYVVEQVLDPDGNVISETEPTVKRQIVSEEVSAELAGMLEHVVMDADGSGRYAYVPGIRVGGKTGTSEKLDKLVDGEVVYNVSSFLGVFPSDDPEIAILFLMDEPIMENTYGSVIAAPVVGAIIADIAGYLGISPIYTEEELAVTEIKVPYVTNMELHMATTNITKAQLDFKIEGNGTTVVTQVPNSTATMPKGGTVILYTDEESVTETVTVPNVVGMSGQQANRTILNAGLNIKVVGIEPDSKNSIAVAQDPAADTEVEVGAIIEVTFADSTAPTIVTTDAAIDSTTPTATNATQ